MLRWAGDFGLCRAGVVAGKAAGMQVVAVPSMPAKDARPLYSSADVIYSSLLDFEPQLWGLPPLNDRNSLAPPPNPTQPEEQSTYFSLSQVFLLKLKFHLLNSDHL